MDWIVFPQNSYFEALNLNVTVLGGRVFQEVIKVKWGHKGGPYTSMATVLLRRWRETPEVCRRREKAMWGPSKRMAICKLRREISGEAKPAHILILDIEPPELWKVNFYCLSQPASDILLMVALADW